MIENKNSQAIIIADYKAMLTSPTVPANILDREAKSLMRFAQEHQLGTEESEMVAYIRVNHHAQLATVGLYMSNGNTIEKIADAYQAREYLEESAQSKGKPSIGALLAAADYFADSEDAEHFQELLLELPNIYPYLDYSDTVVKVALEDAQGSGIIYLSDLIERSR